MLDKVMNEVVEIAMLSRMERKETGKKVEGKREKKGGN